MIDREAIQRTIDARIAQWEDDKRIEWAQAARVIERDLRSLEYDPTIQPFDDPFRHVDAQDELSVVVSEQTKLLLRLCKALPRDHELVDQVLGYLKRKGLTSPFRGSAEAHPPTGLAPSNIKEMERQRCVSILMQMNEKLYGEPGLQASHERAVLSRAIGALNKE